MYSQVDAEGYRYQLLDTIVDQKQDGNAIHPNYPYININSGQKRMIQTTAVWNLLVQWKNGTQEWVPLKILKNSNPIEVSELSVARGIDKEPAFTWWVPYALRRHDIIIAGLNSWFKRTTHEYVIELPRSDDEALRFDKLNGNTFWRDAINKEMENIKVAFEIKPEGYRQPVNYTLATGHLIFDVRMTLDRKARWVKDGHKTPIPEWSTFAVVISRESVRIVFTYAELNGLIVCAAGI